MHTSPRLSCQGLGLNRSSKSIVNPTSSLLMGLDVPDISEGGAVDIDGHSTGAIILAGIKAPTIASLEKEYTH